MTGRMLWQAMETGMRRESGAAVWIKRALAGAAFILLATGGAAAQTRYDRGDPTNMENELRCANGVDWATGKCRPGNAPTTGGTLTPSTPTLDPRTYRDLDQMVAAALARGERIAPGSLPRGTGTLYCACHGSVVLGSTRQNPYCMSGYDVAMACQGPCAGGGLVWGARCM